MSDTTTQFLRETTTRLEQLSRLAEEGGLDEAIDLIASSLRAGGIVQAFGTGHSQAFAMEIAGRAGGLIPTNNIALRDVTLFGSQDVSILSDPKLERDPAIVDELWDITAAGPDDVFVIASNSGVNGSIVGMALRAKENGNPVVAVTSIDHTSRVTPKHPSGKRLSEVADVVIDNLAPYGDTTLTLDGDEAAGIGVGAVSSLTAAFVAQLLTIGVAERLAADGTVAPIYLSANIPGGDDHNHRLEDQYGGRIRRHA
ncbi:sugar isomerase domain-containing protein [Mumia sp. DW29H23]|uniref:sugar isomerase domain-containing protein n=1 Tax=Mumia sp. DW29H23 TaxID=3421241 RepID=UPI003D681974